MSDDLGWHSWRLPTADGPLVVRVEFGAVGMRAECVRVTIEAADPDRPAAIRSTELRAVADRLKSVRSERQETLRRIVQSASDSTLEARANRQLGLLEQQPKKAGGRPALYGPAHYAEVARVYLSGGSTPTKAVQSAYHVSYPTAANWVTKARKLGLLPATSRGRIAGSQAGEAD